MVKISLVVMTLNEAHNIRRCLESSIGIADELLVVDSLSTDDTVAISESLGARVILQPFLGFMEQRQFAINHAAHPFILILDADEVLSEQLRQSILHVKAHWTHDCYYMNRLSNIGDQWIRHGGWYPDRKMRLFDRTQFAVEGINPHDKLVPVKGARSTHLKGDMLHYTNSDIESRVKTINHFSTLAAKAFYERGKRGSWLRLLFKPFFRFFVEYVLRRGFMDGFYGFVIAITSAQYVFLREAKLREKGKR
ncbi:MAG: glycosyltransferase family 2 protein [Haliscomenobacter sp.]|nr:glycosyltransferase family 2 protein [Haliscomenobacter sp.]